MEYLKICEMAIEQRKDEIYKLEQEKKKDIKNYISSLSEKFGFKVGDVLSDGSEIHEKRIIIYKLKSKYIPTYIFKHIRDSEADEQGIRKYGLHCEYYSITKKGKRNKIKDPYYQTTFIEDWKKVGTYDVDTDTITYLKEKNEQKKTPEANG